MSRRSPKPKAPASSNRDLRHTVAQLRRAVRFLLERQRNIDQRVGRIEDLDLDVEGLASRVADIEDREAS